VLISFGHGGWVAVDEIIGLPGRLYVRLRESDGRLRAYEVYLDASPGSEPIERADLRDIPLSNIEAVVNSEAKQLLDQIDLPAPDLSTLASHFAATAPRFDDAEFRLQRGPTDGLTDSFLRDVARAYAAAVARGERPNLSMAEQVGYPLKSVQRWVYTARQRGIMPRGSKGRPG
jgi:hypothetical protein